jgi:hypothetical protein
VGAYIPVAPDSFLYDMVRVPRRGAPRWRSIDGDRLYEWDGLHGEVEVYDKRGHHLGVADGTTGELLKPAERGRRIDV